MALFFRQSTVSLLFRCHSIITQKLHQAGGDLVRRSQRFDGTAIIATRAEQICFGGMGIVISVTRLLLLYPDDTKRVDETLDFRWRSGEADDRRVKIIDITGQYGAAVALGPALFL